MKNALTVYGSAFVSGLFVYVSAHVLPGDMSWAAWQPILVAATVAGLQAVCNAYHLNQPQPEVSK